MKKKILNYVQHPSAWYNENVFSWIQIYFDWIKMYFDFMKKDDIMKI